MENKKKWKFDLQVLICNPEFHNKSNFIQRSDFIAYTSIWAKYVIKYSKWKKKNWIVYFKWRIESNCSWKRAFHLNKRAPLFDKATLGLSWQVIGDRIPWLEDVLTLLIQIKKKLGVFLFLFLFCFFSKRHF